MTQLSFMGRIFMLAMLTLIPTVGMWAQQEKWTTIKNGIEWTDTEGYVVQAHGGNFLQVGKRWYLIGEDRARSWNPDVNLYSTEDFVTWKFEGKIIQNRVTHEQLGVSRMIERPKLMYNAQTRKFVVWCHWGHETTAPVRPPCLRVIVWRGLTSVCGLDVRSGRSRATAMFLSITTGKPTSFPPQMKTQTLAFLNFRTITVSQSARPCYARVNGGKHRLSCTLATLTI